MAKTKLTKEDVLDLIPTDRLHDVVDEFFNQDVYCDFARRGWDEDRPYNEVLEEFLAETIAHSVSKEELVERGWID